MDNNPHGSDDSHDEENGFFSSDGEDDPAMYGIRLESFLSLSCAMIAAKVPTRFSPNWEGAV
jgi:hypothetical protein